MSIVSLKKQHRQSSFIDNHHNHNHNSHQYQHHHSNHLNLSSSSPPLTSSSSTTTSTSNISNCLSSSNKISIHGNNGRIRMNKKFFNDHEMNESPPRTPPPPTTSPPEVAATATPTPTSPPSQASPSIVHPQSTPELNNNIVRYETIHSKMDNLSSSSSSSSPELIHKSPRSLYSLFGDAKRRMLLINNNNHQQDLSIDSSFDEEDDDDEEEEVDEEEDEEEDDDEIVEERNDIHRNGEEENVNEQNQWKMDENGKRIAKSTTITDTSRCNYVNVIVNCSNRLSSNGKSNRTTKMVDQVTLTIERLVDDPHLRKAWKRCQFIDLFLYSTCSTTIINDNNVEDDHHQSIRIWPAHRIVVCAHSSHVKQFFHSYPDVEMLTKQIDSFIKLNEEDNKEQEEEEEDDDDDEIIDVVNSEHNRIDLLKLQSMEETKRKLSNSTIPVLMINVPAIDLRDLLRLMYFGQIVVNRNRLNSLHQSANQLKMNSINIVEMNKLLSDLSNVEPKNEINKTSQTVITGTKMIKEMNKRNENEIELVAECSNKSIESSKLISNTTSTATFFPFMRSYSLDQLEQRNQPSIFMNNNQQMKRKEPSMDLEKLYEDILQQRLNECLEIEKQKNKKIHNNKPTSTCTNDLLLPMNPIEVPQRKGPFLDIPSFGPLSSDLSASMSPLSPFIRANPFEHAFNPFAVSMLNNHHQHQKTNCSPQLIPPSFGGRLLPQYQQSPPQSPLIPTPQYQRQTSAPANLTPFTNKPTHQQLSPLIYDGHTTASNLNSRSSLIGKARRGRRPNVEPMPPSSINHQRISLEFDNNQHNNLESGESHQCGANGWQTTPGSGMNCQRKRCQNLYHAAKYRDRRRQRMEQLYNEKESMEKLKNVQLTKIATLNMQINNLIRQRTVSKVNVIQTEIDEKTSNIFKCPVCGRMFTDIDSIRSHLLNEHGNSSHSLKLLANVSLPETATTSSASNCTIVSMEQHQQQTKLIQNIAKQLWTMNNSHNVTHSQQHKLPLPNNRSTEFDHIRSLIKNDGNVTHIETNPIAPLIPIPFINDTNVSIPSNIFPIGSFK